jgi:hypothetical protein
MHHSVFCHPSVALHVLLGWILQGKYKKKIVNLDRKLKETSLQSVSLLTLQFNFNNVRVVSALVLNSNVTTAIAKTKEENTS